MDNIFFKKSDLDFLGKNVRIGKTVRIRHPEKVRIHDNVIIDDFVYISGQVTIGRYSHIASNVTLSASKSSITIEKYVGISAGTKVFAGSSNYLSISVDLPTFPEEIQYGALFGPVHIKNSVLVGANSVILPNTTIEKGIAIAAGSHIGKNNNIPPWSIISRDGIIVARSGKQKYLNKLKEIENEK
jgi:galactoside O-acetyltransferase